MGVRLRPWLRDNASFVVVMLAIAVTALALVLATLSLLIRMR